MKVFSYVVEHDEGREPNPYFDCCTLCRCKFSKRAQETRGRKGHKNVIESANVGDWIVGTGGNSKKSAGHGKLIYAMQVDEKLTRWKYFKDSRFQKKKPEPPVNEFEKNEQFALVSWHFYYFGKKAIEIPDVFKNFEKTGPGFRCHFDQADICGFLEWLKKRKPGMRGEPCYPVPPDELKGSDRCKSSC